MLLGLPERHSFESSIKAINRVGALDLWQSLEHLPRFALVDHLLIYYIARLPSRILARLMLSLIPPLLDLCIPI